VVDAVLDDVDTAPVSDAEKVLYTFAREIARENGQVDADVYETMRAAGWSDEAAFDALTAASLFTLFNTWVDGGGVKGMPDEAYAAGAKRLAERGYVG
jgi:alkylhydroperoxidase family enzyme